VIETYGHNVFVIFRLSFEYQEATRHLSYEIVDSSIGQEVGTREAGSILRLLSAFSSRRKDIDTRLLEQFT
jgi:hypothetical protein